MTIDKDFKNKLMQEFARHENDTGSPEVQVAILSNRITVLTDHLRENQHDEFLQARAAKNGWPAPEVVIIYEKKRLRAVCGFDGSFKNTAKIICSIRVDGRRLSIYSFFRKILFFTKKDNNLYNKFS